MAETLRRRRSRGSGREVPRARSGNAGRASKRYDPVMSDGFLVTPGYRLNSATLLGDLHRLVSAFLASDGEHDPLTTLQERFTEDEIVHQFVAPRS
jgi:hypothetical protein